MGKDRYCKQFVFRQEVVISKQKSSYSIFSLVSIETPTEDSKSYYEDSK